ncbi:BTB/POZ domain protein [Rhizoctonia solani AG-3 Rhs1AP]|uniref:BTB/POZ domain protein n=1 Tax=Rhizoctonia solani AG-3 Rhs1AP TaxID=1086054 RepID=X8IWZ9_9AGAM|nr:BTB/POZ domain protein [Rhizoctonia solani AG-3 Rhs1AP]
MAKKKPTTTNRVGSVLYVGKCDDSPDEVSGTEAPDAIAPHPQFFLDNTLVAIQIEKTLFNVHKYQLIKSEVFSEMFNNSKGEGDEPEPGSSPEHPIVIKGVAAADFAALLQVLYESHFSRNQHVPQPPLIIPSFRLANLLNFSELRAYLLPLAEKNLDDVDKINFAREFDIKEWLAPAHVRLCQREKPLNTEEARKLGVDSVLILWRMRGQYRARSKNGQMYCYTCAGITYTGNNYTCQGCNGAHGAGYLRQDGPGSIPVAVDASSVAAEINKWVEDDCIVQD